MFQHLRLTERYKSGPWSMHQPQPSRRAFKHLIMTPPLTKTFAAEQAGTFNRNDVYRPFVALLDKFLRESGEEQSPRPNIDTGPSFDLDPQGDLNELGFSPNRDGLGKTIVAGYGAGKQ